MKSWFGLAISSLMMFMLPACSTMKVASAGVATPPTRPARTAPSLPVLLASAQSAIQREDAVMAIRDAEAAVALAPGRADTRALLGRAYLSAGRFTSAETAFGDALTLDPSLGKAAVTRALAQIALGDKDAALASLKQAEGKGAETDIGLALALAGRVDEAVKCLENAARAADASPRTRQNLALAYALQGRWDIASATASVDLPAAQVSLRMQRWSQIAQHGGEPAIQVAMLLGVVPMGDTGQPAALALAKSEAPVELAIADATPMIAPVAPAIVSSPAPAAIVVAASEPSAAALAQPRIGMPRFHQPAIEPLVLAQIDTPKPAMPLMLKAAMTKRAVAQPSILLAQRVAPRLAVAGGSAFVVQIGAFSSAQRSEAAWNRLSGKVHYISSYKPMGAGLQRGNATLHRLSLSGFASRDDAAKMCSRIKINGGDCFVRATSGDRPVQWVQRKSEGEAA